LIPRIFPTCSILVCVAMLLLPLPILSQGEAPDDEVTQESLRFTQIYGTVEKNLADPVDTDRAIFDGAIRHMLSTLDPFSAFFDRDQFEMLQQQARGEALGFGSILYVTEGKVVVLQTAEGSPSWRAGLGPGDELVSIDGQRLDRLDFRSLVQLLQRSRSHPVRLGVVPPGRVVPRDVDLRPAEVALPTVDRAFSFPEDIAYIHLTAFEEKTAQELKDALSHLGGSKIKGLLLDLRGNHGGMVDSAVAVASLFLKPNLLVLTTRGRSAPDREYRSSSLPAHFDFPLVVLVNGDTASAAEVLAAALQEHDRAVIAGEPTFGKGVVQSVMGLSEHTGLALTVAQYFTPSGRSIQRPLAGTALALDSAGRDPSPNLTFHTDNGRPVTAGGGITPDVPMRPPTRDPWIAFLNERGVITNFASTYLTLHGKVDRSFEPDEKVMTGFRDFLERGQIRVPDEYWKQDQDYLKLRIKTEIFNLAFGLTAGDEVEVRGDPQVRDALKLFARVAQLLAPSSQRPANIHVKRIAM